MAVGDGAHNGAHRQAVEIVVDEDEDAQNEGGQRSAHLGLDVLGSPAAKGGRTAGGVHQGHDDAQQHQEQEDAGIVGNGCHQAVIDDHVQCADGGEILGEQSAHGDADEQGTVGLFGDEGQGDGDDGGNQGPEGAVHAVGGCFVPGGQRRDAQQRGGRHDQDGGPQDGMLFHGSSPFVFGQWPG